MGTSSVPTGSRATRRPPRGSPRGWRRSARRATTSKTSGSGEDWRGIDWTLDDDDDVSIRSLYDHRGEELWVGTSDGRLAVHDGSDWRLVTSADPGNVGIDGVWRVGEHVYFRASSSQELYRRWHPARLDPVGGEGVNVEDELVLEPDAPSDAGSLAIRSLSWRSPGEIFVGLREASDAAFCPDGVTVRWFDGRSFRRL